MSEEEDKSSANESFKSIIDSFFRIGVPEGWGAMAASHPFDTIVVRLQTVGRIDLGGNELLYSGPWDCFTKILRREGLFSLYRGLMMPMLSAMPLHLFTFYVYNVLQLRQTSTGKPMQHYEIIRNGAISGGSTAPLVTPIERIKFCLQVTDGYHIKSRTTIAVIREIYKKEGLSGFTRGTALTFLRDSLSLSIGFLTYFWLKLNYLKNLYRLKTGEKSRDVYVEILGILLTGGVSGLVLAVPVIPIDFLKTQYQYSATTAREVLDEMKHEADRRGISLLRLTFTGTPIALAKAFCQFSILFLCFEMYNKYVLVRRARREENWKDEDYDEAIKEQLDEQYDRYYDIHKTPEIDKKIKKN